MTASTTRCCASVSRRVRLWVCAMLLAVMPLFAVADASVRSAAIIAVDDAYVVNADFQLLLNPRHVDAISRGVSLYFVVELLVEQPRRFWFDRVVAERRLQYRLSYHAITRSYRLTIGNLHRSFDTLDSALLTMSRVRSWPVLRADDLDQGSEYRASIRIRHEAEMLPRPLLVTAGGSREWALATEWARWSFSAEEAE